MAEPCDIFRRNKNGKWLMVVNLEKSFSMKNYSMVKKILKILYACLKKKVYYVFPFLKVSQCKFKACYMATVSNCVEDCKATSRCFVLRSIQFGEVAYRYVHFFFADSLDQTSLRQLNPQKVVCRWTKWKQTARPIDFQVQSYNKFQKSVGI